jgi:hypothetical protein
MIYFDISQRAEMIRQLLTADEFSRNELMQALMFHFEIDLLITKSKTRKVIDLINNELANIYTVHYTKQASDYKTESEWKATGRQVKKYNRPYWFVCIYDQNHDRMKLQARYRHEQTKTPQTNNDPNVMAKFLNDLDVSKYENLAPPTDSKNNPKASKA